MTRLLLVRHAHAGVRGAWAGNDLDRELSSTGHDQARALVEVLRDLHDDITTVASSRAARCVGTVAPLADALGLAVDEQPLLLEGADPAETLPWLVGPDAPSVACSHGDVIGGIVHLLDRRGGATPPLSWEKASVWVLDVADGEVTAARQQPAPTVD